MSNHHDIASKPIKLIRKKMKIAIMKGKIIESYLATETDQGVTS